MLENIVRHMEMGKPPMQAAYDGSKEIAFTIVSMTVSLVAVFIPVLFMGGIVGRLLHEFAVTIARGDPGVGLRVDQPDADAVQPLPAAAARAAAWLALQRVRAHVRRVAQRLRRHAERHAAASAPVTMAVSIVLLGVTVYLFTLVPKGFLPSEDQGRFNVNTEGAQGISFDDMVRPPAARWPTSSMKDPNISSAGVNVGLMGNNATGGSNTGRMFVELKPRDRARRARSTR